MERARPDPDNDFLIVFSTLTVVAWLTTVVWLAERVEISDVRCHWPILALWLSVGVSWVQFRVDAGWWRGIAAGFSLSAVLLSSCVG